MQTIHKQPNAVNNILDIAYSDLEAASLAAQYTQSLSEILRDARDKLQADGQNIDAVKAQYEIDFLSFNISGNKLGSMCSGTNDKGERWEYPSLNTFTQDQYNYLIDRQTQAQAPILKARYAHILWLSPQKTIQFAQAAVDEYRHLICLMEARDVQDPTKHFGLAVLEALENAFYLSLSVGYKMQDIRLEILRVILLYSFESTSSYVIRMRLVELMLAHKKAFDNADFINVSAICEKLIKVSHNPSKHTTIDILSLIIKVQKRIGGDAVDYQRRIAELWESLSVEREDDTNMVSTEFCKNAIKIYRKLKDKAKIKELELRLTGLKKNIKLSGFSQNIDIKDLRKKAISYAAQLSEKEPDAILRSLMLDKGLLPTTEEVEYLAKATNKDDFLSLFPTSFYDHNGNVVQHFVTEEEHRHLEFLQSYRFILEIEKITLLGEIFLAAIKKKKLTANAILQFLHDHSWLGKELTMSVNGERQHRYCWLALIAPALNEYFTAVECYSRGRINDINFVLCIDSLVLKIEGLLRDICAFRGITTYEMRPDKGGRTISMEKDVHKLLFEEELVTIIDKDDLMFFKFLLVEKAGYNLRHEVAHALLVYRGYSHNYMMLLVMAVLKFGKYDFAPAANTL